MARITGLAVVVAVLFFVLPATPSRAALGCLEEAAQRQVSMPLGYATCSENTDCAAVGGSQCTQGVCFCEVGPLSPFCPCEVAEMAPALSRWGLAGLVGVLAILGIFGVCRREGAA